jgi:predicted Zn-dependent protease
MRSRPRGRQSCVKAPSQAVENRREGCTGGPHCPWVEMTRSTLLAGLAVLGVLATVVSIACDEGEEVLPPDEALKASHRSFQAIDSVLVRIDLSAEYEGVSLTAEAEIGYESDEVMFERYVSGGDLAELEEFDEGLLISDDLYLRSRDGRWYVISPWNQGMSLEEMSGFTMDELSTYYEDIPADITDLERTGSERINGESFLTYEGTVEMDDAPPGEIALWLQNDTYLPRKLRLSIADEEASLALAIEYLEYDLPVVLPKPPSDARPWRDYELPDAPCTGETLVACLAAQTELESIASDSCGGEGRRVCLVPFGQVDPDLVRRLIEYYRDEYGLTVTVLRPTEVPQDMVDRLRGQIDGSALIDHMVLLFPDAYLNSQAVFIGLTPLDIYYGGDTHFRYVFGVRCNPVDPQAVISTFRMDPETYGLPADDELLTSRARKMLTKYIGLLYYDLPTSSDPESPLFDSILGPSDLDRMSELLPVAVTQ